MTSYYYLSNKKQWRIDIWSVHNTFIIRKKPIILCIFNTFVVCFLTNKNKLMYFSFLSRDVIGLNLLCYWLKIIKSLYDCTFTLPITYSILYRLLPIVDSRVVGIGVVLVKSNDSLNEQICLKLIMYMFCAFII